MFTRKKTILAIVFLFLPLLPVLLTIWYLNRYSGIDFSIRVLLAAILLSLTLAQSFLGTLFVRRNYKKTAIAFLSAALLTIVGSSYFSYINIRVYRSINDMIVTQTVVDYNVAVLSNSPAIGLSDLEDKIIGLIQIADESDRAAVLEFLDTAGTVSVNTLQTFESPIGMLNALYKGEIDAMILGSGFKQIFSETEGFADIEDEVRIIETITIENEMINEQPSGSRAPFLDEPFSILLIGEDHAEGFVGATRADSLILMTVNPQELSLTMTSIPRDSYVPNPFLNNMMDKINHTNHGGSLNVVEAVSTMFDIEIPYFITVNFTAVVDLIDALGGVMVDVPIAFSEQNSRRQFGRHRIHLEPGLQLLNGEEALALSRHRRSPGVGDPGRALHQQLVLEAIIAELISGTTSINEFLDVLNVMGANVDTNLTMHEMTSGMQFLLDLAPVFRGRHPMDVIQIISMVLTGEPGRAMTPWMSTPLSVFFPFQGAIDDAREIMMINLGQADAPLNTHFHFNGFEELARRQWIQNSYQEQPGAAHQAAPVIPDPILPEADATPPPLDPPVSALPDPNPAPATPEEPPIAAPPRDDEPEEIITSDPDPLPEPPYEPETEAAPEEPPVETAPEGGESEEE